MMSFSVYNGGSWPGWEIIAREEADHRAVSKIALYISRFVYFFISILAVVFLFLSCSVIVFFSNHEFCLLFSDSPPHPTGGQGRVSSHLVLCSQLGLNHISPFWHPTQGTKR